MKPVGDHRDFAPQSADQADTFLRFRVEPRIAHALDEWRLAQHDHPSRPDAIRRLVETGLGLARLPLAGSEKKAARAAILASNAIDGREDASASELEREDRKQQILQGPGSFRAIRKD
jgi:hypothetical protein